MENIGPQNEQIHQRATKVAGKFDFEGNDLSTSIFGGYFAK